MSVIIAVLVASVVMFVVGAIWYTFLFQREWGKVHAFDKLSKKEQQKLMSEMGPIYGTQLIVTIVTAVALVWFETYMPCVSWPIIAGMLWLGFIVPTQISGVLFSRTENKYKPQQILIMSSEAFVRIFLAAWAISFF